MTVKPRLKPLAEWRGASGPHIAFAPDGRRWAASDGRILQIFVDAACERRQPIPGEHAFGLRFDRGGRSVLVAPHAWDLQNGAWRPQAVSRLERPEATLRGAFEPSAAAFGADGEDLLMALRRRPVQPSDAVGPAVGERLLLLHGTPPEDETIVLWEGDRTDRIRALAVGERLLVAGGALLSVWDRATLRHVGDLDAHRLAVLDVAFSPDGNWIASVGADGLLALWSAVSRSLTVIASTQATPDELLAVAFHPTLPMLATGGADGTLRFWSLNGMPLHDEPLGAPVSGIAFAPQGDRMAVALSGPDQRLVLMGVC